jgi:hypothetical protein
VAIEWIEVSSDRITHYAYDTEAATIHVIFKKGGTQWRYEDCTAEIWEQFQLAESKGKFINEELNNHPHGAA